MKENKKTQLLMMSVVLLLLVSLANVFNKGRFKNNLIEDCSTEDNAQETLVSEVVDIDERTSGEVNTEVVCTYNTTEQNTSNREDASQASSVESTESNTAIEAEGSTDAIISTANSITEQGILCSETETEHTHNFVTDISYLHYDEVGHYENVCVAEGYEEKIYAYYDNYCYYCGAIMDDWRFNEILDHSAIHGAYGTHKEVVETIWHEPIYEYVWVVDKEEYEEEVKIEKCIECGYVK